MDPDDLPTVDPEALDLTPVAWIGPAPAPWLLVRATAADGRDIDLCDFASAGATGSPYRTWLPLKQ